MGTADGAKPPDHVMTTVGHTAVFAQITFNHQRTGRHRHVDGTVCGNALAAPAPACPDPDGLSGQPVTCLSAQAAS